MRFGKNFMVYRMLLIALLVGGPTATHASAAALDSQFDAEQGIWRMANSRIETLFQLGKDGRFRFLEARLLPSGITWRASEDSCPIRLITGSKQYDCSTSYRLVAQSSEEIPRNGLRQTIVLDDIGATARMELELELYKDQPVLRQSLRFRNLLSPALRVREADMLPYAFEAGETSYRTFRVNQWVRGGTQGNFETITDQLIPGTPVTVYSGAWAQHCSWLAVRDSANRGFFTGWEFNGRAAGEIGLDPVGGRLDFSVKIQSLNRLVESGKEFVVPTAFLGFYLGDWSEAGYRTQQFVEAAIAKPIPDENFPYVIWDSWGYVTDFNEATLRENARIAASLGIEVFVIDLGWARNIGDWVADPQKFPSGLRALSDYVHSLGMKFGLHFPLAEASADAPVLRQYPDWRASESYDYFNAESLCLAHEPVRRWVVGEAVRMIDEYGVDWIVQDGENMVKTCTKQSHTHDPLDSNYSNAVDGIDAAIEQIQRQRPDVLWENCENGGAMMTFKMVRNYVTSIAADDSGPLTTRQATYGVTYPFPPRYSVRYMATVDMFDYVVRSYMFGGPWIFMNRLPLVEPWGLEVAASEIRTYKSLREKIREGKVYHLTAPPAEGRIDALQSYHERTGSAVVLAYRTNTPIESRSLRLRGVNRRRNYQIRFHESGTELVMSGADLLDKGLPLVFPGIYTTEIIYVEPVESLSSAQ